jgi:four helix bundle protein
MANRQDLCARALRFSIAIGKFHKLAAVKGPSVSHAALQLYRAATGVGANLEEGQVSRTRSDMAAKYAIALREAREARYWLNLLAEEPPLKRDAQELAQEAGEFVAMLTVSVRKLREDRSLR